MNERVKFLIENGVSERTAYRIAKKEDKGQSHWRPLPLEPKGDKC